VCMEERGDMLFDSDRLFPDALFSTGRGSSFFGMSTGAGRSLEGGALGCGGGRLNLAEVFLLRLDLLLFFSGFGMDNGCSCFDFSEDGVEGG
jgi:hypothetical protein